MVDTAILLSYWNLIKDPLIVVLIFFLLIYSHDWFKRHKPKKSPEEEMKLKYEQCKKHYEEYVRLWNEINNEKGDRQ